MLAVMADALKNFRDQVVDSIPLGRIGKPQDVSAACIYLSSEAGSFINGAILPVDGGALCKPKL